ncbi:MAG TPA: AprI/Inh family metalloprotease inhibitor [Pseudolabrys sp.]|nr:AprI/Inh family metalloprotease inhibitor [Pseudolabrys sp.]
MARFTVFAFALLSMCGTVFAQTPATQSTSLGESAKAMIGAWEFSNADRDKICTVTFKTDPSPVGFKLEFNKECAELFPLVSGVAGWNFPENDLLRMLDAQGKALVEFSEVEDGIYEAPTQGVGVLFLQNPASAGAPPKPPEQVAGDWAIMRAGKALCQVTLTIDPAEDGMAIKIKPGCDPTIARLNFTQWKIDGDELMLVPAKSGPWRFGEADANTWRRVPEGANPYSLVRQ